MKEWDRPAELSVAFMLYVACDSVEAALTLLASARNLTADEREAVCELVRAEADYFTAWADAFEHRIVGSS